MGGFKSMCKSTFDAFLARPGRYKKTQVEIHLRFQGAKAKKLLLRDDDDRVAASFPGVALAALGTGCARGTCRAC